jgi:hypothetical protein
LGHRKSRNRGFNSTNKQNGSTDKQQTDKGYESPHALRNADMPKRRKKKREGRAGENETRRWRRSPVRAKAATGARTEARAEWLRKRGGLRARVATGTSREQAAKRGRPGHAVQRCTTKSVQRCPALSRGRKGRQREQGGKGSQAKHKSINDRHYTPYILERQTHLRWKSRFGTPEEQEQRF